MAVLRRVLDILRVEVAPTNDHEILQSPGHDELTLVHGTQVSRAEECLRGTCEPGAEHLRRLCLAAPIPRRDAAAGDPDLAHMIRRAFDTRVRVDDSDGEHVRRLSDGDNSCGV